MKMFKKKPKVFCINCKHLKDNQKCGLHKRTDYITNTTTLGYCISYNYRGNCSFYEKK